MAYDSFLLFVVGEVDGATRYKYRGSSHAAAFRGIAPNNQLLSAEWDYSKYGFDRCIINLGIGWNEAITFGNNDGLVFYVDMPDVPFADPGHRYKQFAGLITSVRRVLHNNQEALEIEARGPAYVLQHVFTKYTETYINQSPEQIAKSIWFKHVYNDPVYFYVSGDVWLPKYDIDQEIYGADDPYPWLSIVGNSGITINRYEITHSTRIWDVFDRLATLASYDVDKLFMWGYQPWWRPIGGALEQQAFKGGFYFWDTKLAQFQNIMHTFELGSDVRQLDEIYENAVVTDVLVYGGRHSSGYDMIWEKSLTDQEMREGSGRQRFVVHDPSIKTAADADKIATGVLNIYGNDDPYYRLRATSPLIDSGGALIPAMGRIALSDPSTGEVKQTASQFSALQVSAFQRNEEPTVTVSIGHRPLPNINRHSGDSILGNGPFPQDSSLPPWTFPPDATNSVTASVTNPSFPTESATESVASESIVSDKDFPEFPPWWPDITPSGTVSSPTVSSPTVSGPTVSASESASASVSASESASVSASESASATATESPEAPLTPICVDLIQIRIWYVNHAEISPPWFPTRPEGFMQWEELIGCDGLDINTIQGCIYTEWAAHQDTYGLAFYDNSAPIVTAENFLGEPYINFWRASDNCDP